MPYDPFNILGQQQQQNPFLQQAQNPFLPAQPRQPAIPPLPPEEESSLLGKLAGGALGGLGYLGSSLEKALGGRAIRGLLGGKPEELLSIIPFSDTMGITDEANKVTGKELLGYDKNDDSWMGTIAGFGAELATDPAMYLSFGAGAVTPAGRAAIKAGVQPTTTAGRLAGLAAGSPEIEKLAIATGKSTAELAGERLGAHVGVGLPWADPIATFDLTGPLGAAGKALSRIPGASAIQNAAGTVGQGLGALFQKSKMDQVEPFGQGLARNFVAGEPQAIEEARRSMTPIMKHAYENNLINAKGEMAPHIASEVRNFYETGGGVPRPEVAKLVELMRPELMAAQQANEAVGIPSHLNDNLINYFPRQQALLSKDTNWLGRASVAPSEDAARQEFLKGIPTAGEKSINELTSNPAYRQLNEEQLKTVVRRDFLGGSQDAAEAISKLDDPTKLAINATLAANKQGPILPGQDLMFTLKDLQAKNPALFTTGEKGPSQLLSMLTEEEAKFNQAGKLANFVKTSVPEEYAKQGMGFFGNDPLNDLSEKLIRDARNRLKATGLHEGIAAAAKADPQAFAAATAGNGVPVAKVLADAGLTLQYANKDVGAMSATLAAFQKAGFPVQNLQDMEALRIPENLANVITKFTQAGTAPAGLKPLLDIFDSFTNVGKTFGTVLWPANQGRNQMTAGFMGWVHDAFDPRYGKLNPWSYVQPWLDARAWKNGEVIAGAGEIPFFKALKMNDAQASQKLSEMISEMNVPGRHMQQAQETLGDFVTKGNRVPVPGAPQEGLLDQLAKAIPRTKEQAMPWNVQNAFGSRVDQFGPAAAGRGVASYLDDVNRVSTFIAKLRQGYEPATALAETKLTHFDFSNLSSFERNVMRRAIPFYGWMRQAIPEVVTQLIERPGGKMATTIRGVSDLNQGTGFLPDYLQKGIAVPVGGENEAGTKRYLSSLGTPMEDLGGLINPRGLDVTGMQILGNLNPLIKGPLEYATGKQFYSGRDLADLSNAGLTGNTAVDQLIMNSPLSRAATTLRTLGDERKDIGAKATNLLTGARLTDVDMNKARSIATRELIDRELRGQPGIHVAQRMYARPEDLANLTPQDMMMLRLQATLEKESRAKKKAAAGALAGGM